jgi:VWFA-related protein
MKNKTYLPGVTALCALVVCAASMWAAQDGAQQKENKAPDSQQGTTITGSVLRVTTRLVPLDVIVEDKKGRPVENLKVEDFTLLEDGKPQTIAIFSTESSKAREESAGYAVKSEPPPNVFGNRIHHANEAAGSVTVLLFDVLNTSFHDQAYARTQILKFLRQLRPQDHVAIYVLTKKLNVINEFTQDSKSLLEAVERFQAMPSMLLRNSSQPWVSPADTGVIDLKAAVKLANMMNAMNGKLGDLADADRLGITSQAIEAIANHVAGIPGRKNLVWVSGSFPVSISFKSTENSPVDAQSRNFVPQLLTVARALNQSNMAIYPVDARGILIPAEFDASAQHPFSHYSPATETGVGQDEGMTMDMLAERSGGRAYHNTNDIQGALQKTLAESQLTYLMGFYPQHEKWNGQYHELRLRVNRPGVTLRYRKGYFTVADPGNTAETTRNALQAAMWSPVDATTLGIEARIQTIDTTARKMDLRVDVDAGGLQFGEANGRHQVSVDAIFLQLGPGDAVVASDPLTYKLDAEEKEFRTILQRGWALQAPIAVHPTTKTLRVVVRDGKSGSLGSVTLPLEKFLPPLMADNHAAN